MSEWESYSKNKIAKQLDWITNGLSLQINQMGCYEVVSHVRRYFGLVTFFRSLVIQWDVGCAVNTNFVHESIKLCAEVIVFNDSIKVWVV